MTIDCTKLTRLLEETGYFQNYLTFGEGNVRPWDWERTGRFLSGKSKLLWEGLLCGKEVSRNQLERAISKPLVKVLLERKLCSLSSGKITFGLNALISSGGFGFFVSRGSLAEGYFGEDSRILMSLRPQLIEGRGLCLNSGTGAEMLGLSAGRDVALDIEAERSMHPYINTNLELNGISELTKVIAPGKGDRNASYDTIVARVPGLLEFGGIKFPPLVSSGPAGRDRWEELLARAEANLTDDGRMVFIGPFYGAKESKLAGQELTALFARHGLSASINISSKLAMELGIPIFNQTLATAEVCGKKPRTELLPVLEKELESRGYSHAFLVKGVAWKSRKSAPGNIVDLSDHYYGTWLT